MPSSNGKQEPQNDEELAADYTAAMTQECAAWRQFTASKLDEAERDEVYARWKAAAALTKVLANELTDALRRKAPRPPQ